jgi:hypothetical protein
MQNCLLHTYELKRIQIHIELPVVYLPLRSKMELLAAENTAEFTNVLLEINEF